MKVALVAEWLDPWRGGAETSTQQFIHHLMAGNVELHLITRSRPSPTPGMQVHTIGGASMSRTRRSVTFAHRARRLLRADSFDVVHAISPCLSADIYQPRGGTVAETIERNLACRKNRAARSIKRYANRLNLKQRHMLSMERKLLGEPAGPIVVAISDYVVRQLKKHYSLPDERIRKIFNGVDADPTSQAERSRDRATIRGEFNIRPGDLLVLVVAHNFRLKGVGRWMEALSVLVRRGVDDVRSLVLGKGDTERWHRLAARLGISEFLTFVGPSERVRTFHHAADVLVHPTYYDPCSRVVLEAMGSGLPCVTTVWDGASEIIRDGRDGYVLDDPWDVEALVDRIDRLRDPGLRRLLGESARSAAKSASMARHTREMMSLYDSLVTAGASS